MFGSIGGLVEFRASLLASRGFAVLALAYFAYEDLPKELLEEDLDYFEEAANFLLAHPKVLRTIFLSFCAILGRQSPDVWCNLSLWQSLVYILRMKELFSWSLITAY